MTKSLAHQSRRIRLCSPNFEDLVTGNRARSETASDRFALAARWGRGTKSRADRAKSRVRIFRRSMARRSSGRVTRRRRIGLLSRPAVAFAISITTTPIFQRNRRTPAITLPPPLAVAESVGANGREAITAIALAYEVQCRLCDAASIRARGWDHPTYGAFSTALAAAKLMKLDRGENAARG